ncbi:prostaglandin E synthase 3 isoform 2-T2 [Sylvia borin]
MRGEKLLEGQRAGARAGRGRAPGGAAHAQWRRREEAARAGRGDFAASPRAERARGIVGARPRRAPSPPGATGASAGPPGTLPAPPDRDRAARTARDTAGSPSRTPQERPPEPSPSAMQPASAKWYDRRDYVFIEFCVEDSKDVNVNFEKSKLTFSCLGGSDNFKHLNEIDLFNNIDPNESKHKRTDRSILCCLRKGESGQAWPRLTKERAKLNWLSVDFNNWKDWEDDSDEDMSNFDRFSEMMNNMGGDDDVDLPEVDGADDDSPDSDDEKMPDLE